MQPDEAVAEERVRRRPLRRVLSQAQTDEVAELRREACAAEPLSIRQLGGPWRCGGLVAGGKSRTRLQGAAAPGR